MTEVFENVRQQFDNAPYPRHPLEASPKDTPQTLYKHNCATAFYYRNRQVIDPQNLTILDAGCGSGYKALALALANPGAKIVGVDFSTRSIELAKKRLQYHEIKNADFHTLSLEEVANLGIEFDYINCDEVLYLLPDPVIGLQALKSALKPNGIIRSNLHSQFQRFRYFRAQKLFEMMGLMEENVTDGMAIDLVRDTMNALKDFVDLKTYTWGEKLQNNEEGILANFLLRQDRGYTIPQLFDILDRVGLEFISMVSWRQWDVMDLFENPDDLPAFLGLSLPETSIIERLHLYELIHPNHRLLDFWCGNPGTSQAKIPIENWTHWDKVRVHLHPLLQNSSTKAALEACLRQHRGFSPSEYLPIPGLSNVFVDSVTATGLLPLFDKPQTMPDLVTFWKKTRPLNPITLEPTTPTEAFDAVRDLLVTLEDLGFVMLEGTG
ncbi:class I SAM-dependent methyltransferase [Geitlerinema sp. CS-897]|nr:class I SAM-dependent methyltransferase [Geitlerinema sp. CS-897]